MLLELVWRDATNLASADEALPILNLAMKVLLELVVILSSAMVHARANSIFNSGYQQVETTNSVGNKLRVSLEAMLTAAVESMYDDVIRLSKH